MTKQVKNMSEEDIKQILAKRGFLISVWEIGDVPTPLQIDGFMVMRLI